MGGGGATGSGATAEVDLVEGQGGLWWLKTSDGRTLGGPFVSREHGRKAVQRWAEAQTQAYFIDHFRTPLGDGWWVWHPAGDLHGPFDRKREAKDFAEQHFESGRA